MGKPALLPCPFCGGKASSRYCEGELVSCDNRKQPHCPGSFGCTSPQTWNRRFKRKRPQAEKFNPRDVAILGGDPSL